MASVWIGYVTGHMGLWQRKEMRGMGNKISSDKELGGMGSEGIR